MKQYELRVFSSLDATVPGLSVVYLRMSVRIRATRSLAVLLDRYICDLLCC